MLKYIIRLADMDKKIVNYVRNVEKVERTDKHAMLTGRYTENLQHAQTFTEKQIRGMTRKLGIPFRIYSVLDHGGKLEIVEEIGRWFND